MNYWDELYKMTNAECGRCKAPYSCCDANHCELAEEYALERGVVLERTVHPILLFMGPEGCTVSPELRPLCTVYTCDIGALGFHKTDPEWTDRYWELRELCSRLMQLKRGVQIVNIPIHAESDLGHRDRKYGFVTSVCEDVVFCRYWSKRSWGELRTKLNSEGTSVGSIVIKDTVPLRMVEDALSQIYGH